MKLLTVSALGNVALAAALVLAVNTCVSLDKRRDALVREVAELQQSASRARVAAQDLRDRNDALLAGAAQACGQEGTAAFDRGVRTGMAVCQARAPQ